MASDLWKTGLGLIWRELLEEDGYHCLEDLAAATDERLLAIPGIGPMKLRAIRRVAPYRDKAAPGGAGHKDRADVPEGRAPEPGTDSTDDDHQVEV
jgi:hypothetical protein